MTLGGRFWEYLKVTPSLLSSNGRHGSTGYLYTVILTGMEFHSKPATRVMPCNAVGTSAKTNVCLQGITIFVAEASGSPRVNGNLQWLCSNRTLPRKAKKLIAAPQLQPTMQTQTSQRHDPKISQATSIHWIHLIQNYSKLFKLLWCSCLLVLRQVDRKGSMAVPRLLAPRIDIVHHCTRMYAHQLWIRVIITIDYMMGICGPGRSSPPFACCFCKKMSGAAQTSNATRC